MARYLRLAYGLAAYGSFLAVAVYLIGFVGDFGVPKTVNAGGEVDGVAIADDVNVVAEYPLTVIAGAAPGDAGAPTVPGGPTRCSPCTARRTWRTPFASLGS